MNAIEKRIQSISDKWFLRDPVLFMVLMSHKVEPNKGLRHIIRCGKGTIEYGYDYELGKISDEVLEENLRAEVIRILLGHPYRRYNGKKDTAYIASNLVLNENYMFRYLKYKVHDFWNDNSHYRRHFEFYYSELLKLPGGFGGSDVSENGDDGLPGNSKSPSQGKDTDNSSSQDEDLSDEAGSAKNSSLSKKSSKDESTNEINGLSMQDEDLSEGGNPDGQSISVCEIPSQDESEDYSQDESMDETNELSEQSEELSKRTELWDEDDYIEQQIKEIIEWANSSMTWGSLSGDLVQILLASLKPKIDYRKILSGFRATVLSSQQMLTRFKPSRRYGFEYMGKKSQFKTKLLIGVDVSGSVSNKEIRKFYSIVNRFFKYGIQTLSVQQFDCELKGKPIEMKKAKQKIFVQGRGGTCFQPLINFFSREKNQYDGLIIFTDGYAVIPEVKPHIARKTLWICNNKWSYEHHHEWMTKIGRCCWIDDSC
jgi:Uncharacterized protein conserved in bacteria